MQAGGDRKVCYTFLCRDKHRLLLLRKELEDLLEQKGWRLEWRDIIQDLNVLFEIEICLSGKKYILRSETKGTAGKIFQAAGVALPPKLIQNKIVK